MKRLFAFVLLILLLGLSGCSYQKSSYPQADLPKLLRDNPSVTKDFLEKRK